MKRAPGQTTTEFALTATLLFGLLLAVVDLGRAGFMQHNLDSAAADLARSLATLSGTNSSGNLNTYTPTPLDPANPGVASALDADVAQSARVANGAFDGSLPLASAGAMTLTNGAVTVVATPSLTAPVAITVSITAPFTPVVGIYLRHSILHLQATASAITPAGQVGWP